jgi:hypothetical protein
VQLTVVAVHDGVRWTSDVPAPVGYTAQPSPTQRCGDAAALRAAAKQVVLKLSAVRKAKWRLSVPLVAGGVGHVDATLRRGKRKVLTLGTAQADVNAAGPLTLRFALPKGQRKAGHLQLVLVVTSPDGTKKATTTVPIEVRADAKAKHKSKRKTKAKHKTKGHKR